MSETVSRAPTRPSEQELPVLERENRWLRQENERLQAVEEQLQESLSMLEATADGIVVVDLSGKIKGFNRQFQRLWGIPDAILETCHRDDAVAFVRDQLRDPETFEARRQEFRDQPEATIFELVEFKDGRVLECHSQPEFLGPRVVGRVWSFRDITERKRAEKRLTYLASFPEHNPNPIMEVDPDGRVRYANLAAQRLFPDLHGQGQAHPWLQDWASIVGSLREGQAGTRDVTIGKRSYQQLFHSFAQDGFVRIYGVDITERTRAERLQTQLLQKLSQINEELSHFAYVVSHDLKAPLRGIKLITEWLCEDYGDQLGAEAKEQMTLLQNRVNRMHNLIEGVLQYSRVGRIKEEIVPVNLNELMPMILDAIAPPEHVRITVEGPLPTIECEKTRITQVFQNLLSNAVRFTDKPQGEIHVGCVEEAGFWKFHVTDNGPGIEEKHFERIFRIFQTLAPKDEYESTGVGLTLVKKIVELYGGRIWVESEVGTGSTFFFTLPQRTEKGVDETLRTAAVGS